MSTTKGEAVIQELYNLEKALEIIRDSTYHEKSKLHFINVAYSVFKANCMIILAAPGPKNKTT